MELNKISVGDSVTLWFYDPDWHLTSPRYADCIYLGKTKDGKYKFESETYGGIYTVDPINKKIITPQGKECDIKDSISGLDNLV